MSSQSNDSQQRGALPVHLLGPAHLPGPARTAVASTPVVAVHGITANGLSWAQLADHLTERKVVVLAVDLAGRACARDLPGPYGLERHADDVISVLELAVADHGEPVALLGHSMGAFVAGIVAKNRPELISRLILVDGGFAFPLPPSANDDVDATIKAVIGPAMDRLQMVFESPAQYLAFWAAHPALGPLVAAENTSPAAQRARAYITHDLIEVDGSYRSSCLLEAIRTDGADTLINPDLANAAKEAVADGVSATLVWAARGLMNEEQGLYDEARLAALDLPSTLSVRKVEDVNHYTILFADQALEAIETALHG